MTPNVAAFLTMISHSEGTDRPPAPADAYRCCYGFSHVINNLAEHPAVSGEWMGEPLASLGPAYSHSVSTAAGRYQIIRRTWLSIQAVLQLPDFTAPCQDDAAIYLIKQKGGLALINAGAITDAIDVCASIWASLPGSLAGQPQKSFATLLDVYSAAGGAYV